MQYQFIYPEDNQIIGASFSTNVGATTVQGEVALRPDFPLATPASSQINQIADASGATQVLNWLAYTGINGLGTNTSRDLTGDKQMQPVTSCKLYCGQLKLDTTLL